MAVQKLPSIPEQLLFHFSDEKVAFFLGAGVSRIIGCDDWSSLAYSLVDVCFKSEYINFRKRESIRHIRDPKKIITICFEILCEHDKEDLFYDKIRDSLTPNEDLKEKYDIYKELSEIPAMFLTTNIDELFDEYFENRVFYKNDEFNDVAIRKDALFKIHGTIGDRDTIIFTVPKYLSQYKHPEFLKFLADVFSSYHIVFLGYGMGEFEVLDFLIQKFDGGVELKHWILLPYYEGEEYLIDYDNKYYNNLGVKVISYAKDEVGYNNLYNVLCLWKKEIKEKTDLIVKGIKGMEDLVDKFDGRRS